MQEELGEKGLVVLALSGEEPEKVSAFLGDNGYTVRTASGCSSSGDYGVTGIPHSFLIDPSGKIVWEGYPGDLSPSTVKGALKGAKAMPATSYLAYISDKETPKAVE